MKKQHIREIANYLFKNKIRSRGKFLHIHQIKELDDRYIVYGYFKCKKRIIIKKIELSKDGNPLK